MEKNVNKCRMKKDRENFDILLVIFEVSSIWRSRHYNVIMTAKNEMTAYQNMQEEEMKYVKCQRDFRESKPG